MEIISKSYLSLFVNAANFGVSLKGSILYSTTQPCILCTKMIINAGIEKVVYENGYPDKLSLEMLKEAGVELLQV